MKFSKLIIISLLTMISLSLISNIGSFAFGINVEQGVSDYIPIKWALIVMGEFDYTLQFPRYNAIQKIEHWIQSEGIPYDIIEDDDIEAPIDVAITGKYPLQYSNGTIKYSVIIIMNNNQDFSAVNLDYIYWAIGNGTNAVIFGEAARCVPALLKISPIEVVRIEDYGINKIICSIRKTFSDSIIEYQQDTNQTIDNPYFIHVDITNLEGKTVWYTMHSNTGKNWIGMMNTTYGSGKVFWNTVEPTHDKFFSYSTFSTDWELHNLKFVAHAINFMFEQVKNIDLGLQGYKRWGGAITNKLDEDRLRANEPGWFLYKDKKTAMTCGAGEERLDVSWRFEALKDAVKTLFPIFGIFAHNEGYYNLTLNVHPSDTAYTDMFRFANLDESYEFWLNSRYMLTNTVNAYYKYDKIILEYKANNTLRDYVWRFPVVLNGKYFNGFSDNRNVGRIKHIDGKYVYIEFSEGVNERLEATYGTNPHIHQTSSYLQNITQIYTPKNLTLQLWNASGTINIKVNCTRLGQPNSVKINRTLIDFNYNSATKICLFNHNFNGLKTIEILWEQAPPNPPTLLSPEFASRFDPGKSLIFTWEFSDPDQNDSQFAYRFQLSDNKDFSSHIIDTARVTSSSQQTIQTLPNTVSLYYWRVKTWDARARDARAQEAEGEWSAARPIIVDRLKIILNGVTKNRTNIGTSVYVYFKVTREYDNSQFDGTKGIVYINGSSAIWDGANKYWKLNVVHISVGEWKYRVSSITDTEHHITIINDPAETQVIWDNLLVTINPDATTVTVGMQVDFRVTAVYAYDNRSVTEFTVNILRDGAHFATNNFTDLCNSIGAHQYTTENIIKTTFNLTTFTSNSPTVTWTKKPLTQLIIESIAYNIVIITLIAQTVIVLSIIIIRERKNE